MFSFTKKKGPTLGLDISSDNITVIQLEKTKNGIELLHYGSLPTPPNTIREGLIADPDTVAAVLRDTIDQAGINLGGAPPVLSVAVPGQSVIIRLMPVPVGMPPEELADVVAQEAINHVPFPMSEASLDWSIMPATERTDPDGVRRVDVIVAAIQKTIIDSYWRMAEIAGGKLGKVDTSSLATIRALIFAGYLQADDRLTMSVNIRHDATDINLIRNGMPLFSRSVLLGMETVGEAISRSLEIHLDQALNLLPQIQLSGMAPTDPKVGQAAQIVRTVFGDITDEVGRSLEFYRSQVGEVQIDQILLCGSGSVIPQVDQFIANRLNINAAIVNPLNDVIYDAGLIPESKRPSLTLIAGTVIDPAWIQVPNVVLNLNKEGPTVGVLDGVVARPTVRVYAGDIETPWFLPAIGAALVACLIVAGVSVWSSSFDLPKKEAEINALTAEIDAGTKQLGSLSKMKEENTLLAHKKLILSQIVGHGHPLAAVLQAVRQNTPEGVQVIKVDLSENGLIVEGRAIDFARVAHLAINLSGSPLLSDSTVSWAKRQTADKRVVDFLVTARVNDRQQGPAPRIATSK